MEKLLTIRTLAEKLGYSESYIKQRILTDESFPKPIKVIDKGAPRWLNSEIDSYLRSLSENDILEC